MFKLKIIIQILILSKIYVNSASEDIDLEELVTEDTDDRLFIDSTLKKYFGDKTLIKRRDFKDLIMEYTTKKTHEDLVKIHKNLKKGYLEKKIIYIEKVLFEFMQQYEKSKFTLEETRKILEENVIREYIGKIVNRNTTRHKTEQHEHHQAKKIYEQVQKNVDELTGGDLQIFLFFYIKVTYFFLFFRIYIFFFFYLF